MTAGLHPFDAPLVEGRLVRRYKRFLADVETADGRVTAHCPNPGSMLGMAEPGMRVMLRHVAGPRRRLAWTWELVATDDRTWVGCNTMRPNAVVEHFIRQGVVPGLSADRGMRREVRYGRNSRIDLLLGDEERTYVEVKNTTLAREGVALFPDAVTARGAKHMEDLATVAEAGHGAVVVFFVNRSDCGAFDVARDIDPAYGAAFDLAEVAGVRMVPLGMDVSPAGWRVRGVLPRA